MVRERDIYLTYRLKRKILRDFSPYGKTHRQWIAKWADLKFNPDTDNIEEFIAQFEKTVLKNIMVKMKIVLKKGSKVHLNKIEDYPPKFHLKIYLRLHIVH